MRFDIFCAFMLILNLDIAITKAFFILLVSFL